MGRGRTTTGQVAACLIATTESWQSRDNDPDQEDAIENYDSIDGPSEEEAYLQGRIARVSKTLTKLNDFSGEYKTILHLVGVLSHGKAAKRLTDRAIDLMQDVQNLRKSIYEFVYVVHYHVYG